MPKNLKASSNDRRHSSRRCIRCFARLETLDEMSIGQRGLDVNLQDISGTGVLFETEQEVSVGTKWRMRFIDRNYCYGTAPLVVRNCRQIAEHRFHIGGMFVIEPFILKQLGIKGDKIELNDFEETFTSGNACDMDAA